MSFTLTRQTGTQLGRVMVDLVVQAEASQVLLTDEGGNVLACEPGESATDVQTVAALAAGSFAATCELARLCGEEAFQAISHEGSQTSLFAQAVGEHHLLVVIFERTTTLGLVKLYAAKAARELAALLAVPQHGPAAAPPLAFELAAEGDVFP